MKAPRRMRIDALLVERGLAGDVTQARRLLMAGKVRVADVIVDKAGTSVPIDAAVNVKDDPSVVSRGAHKLEFALKTFTLNVTGKICADVGACSGGFTQVLLRSGAGKVYAIDTASGVLEWEVRRDPRVVVMEGTNACYLESLPEAADFVSIDVSLISLRSVLPKILGWLGPAGDILALIKPHYEASREELPPGAVISEPGVHQRIVIPLLEWAKSIGVYTHGLVRSPLTGKGGNAEFLAWFKRTPGKIAELSSLTSVFHPADPAKE